MKFGKSSIRLTNSGFTLLLIIIAMLISSMNYGNNMAYSMTFLLISLCLTSIVFSIHNLKGIQIQHLEPENGFAGEMIHFTVILSNQSPKTRFYIFFQVPQSRDFFGPFNLAGKSSSQIQLSFPAEYRGLYQLDRIDILSVFPFNLFLLRIPVQVSCSYLVFPKPNGNQPLPDAEETSQLHAEGFHFSGGDDFSGLRPYRSGESQHHIDWKSFARGKPLSIKEFNSGGLVGLWLDFEKILNSDLEIKLSQLAKWSLDADQSGLEFGLKLPNREISIDSGPQHLQKCLKELALYQSKTP
jgi:uncharacterized protein (DUF58 family)